MDALGKIKEVASYVNKKEAEANSLLKVLSLQDKLSQTKYAVKHTPLLCECE